MNLKEELEQKKQYFDTTLPEIKKKSRRFLSFY